MAQFYEPGENASYSQLAAGGGGGVAQQLAAGSPVPPSGIEATKRLVRDDWMAKSDPSYWMKQWEERSKRPEEAGTIESLLRYHGTPEAWAKSQADSAARMYKTDLERDASRGTRKRNFLIALAGMGALSAATSAGAFAGAAAPAAGATAAPAATGATTGTALTGAGKGAIAAGAAGQSAGSGAALTAAGKGAALGAGQLATGGGLTMATVPTIATPAATGGLAAYTPAAVAGGAGSAGTATITAGSGASTLGAIGKYGKWANSALQAANSYSSAKEQEAAAKAARKGTTTTRTPYYNEAISQLARYILQEAQRVYASRQAAYGSQAGDFSPFAALLAQIPSSYRGV